MPTIVTDFGGRLRGAEGKIPGGGNLLILRLLFFRSPARGLAFLRPCAILVGRVTSLLRPR